MTEHASTQATSHLYTALERLSRRSADAFVGYARFSKPSLTSLVHDMLRGVPGSGSAGLISDPYLEAAKLWKPAHETYAQLAEEGLLEKGFVKALARSNPNWMGKSCHPYAHQVEALRTAQTGKSYIVTSGTGSGKTECFMLPVINDVLRHPERKGIQAIIVYPLNALIDSQRERLRKWTDELAAVGLGDRVRFALYTGDTPLSRSSRGQNEARPDGIGKAEVESRDEIRKNPPSILITNVTMLEYMLLRPEDQRILQVSKGSLRWVVLDEAHSYVGSQAAEMALLLRRVRQAFDVPPDKAQVLATSATISGSEVGNDALARFVAALSGRSVDDAAVIHGVPQPVVLPPQNPNSSLNLDAVAAASDHDKWRMLAPHPAVQKLSRELREEGACKKASDIGTQVLGLKVSEAETQALLDALAVARNPETNDKLLSWRAHVFHRSVGGLWACTNPDCHYRQATLRAEDAKWGWGALYLGETDRCQCGSLCLELAGCQECGEVWLAARHIMAGRDDYIRRRRAWNGNTTDFERDNEPVPSDDDEGSEHHSNEDSSGETVADIWIQDPFFPQERALPEPSGLQPGGVLDPQSGRFAPNGSLPDDKAGLPISYITAHGPDCCCKRGNQKVQIRTFHYGSVFFSDTGLPDLLGLLAHPMDKSLPGYRPMDGRRALTFTDSRQGVARLSAKLQAASERNLVRAFIYHSVQTTNSLPPEEKLALQRNLDRKRRFRAGCDSETPEGLEDIASFDKEIRSIEQELAIEHKPVPWNRLVENLAELTSVSENLAMLWGGRFKRALGQSGDYNLSEHPEILAKILLLQELGRRPKIQNNIETMGMAQIIFPKMYDLILEDNGPFADVKRASGLKDEDWLSLARAAIDLIFRQRWAVVFPESKKLLHLVFPNMHNAMSIGSERELNHEIQSWNRRWPDAKDKMDFMRLVRLTMSARQVPDTRVQGFLDGLWDLLKTTCLKKVQTSPEYYALDFSKASLEPVKQAWICPLTRRVINYLVNGRSPFAPDVAAEPESINFSAPPHIDKNGLNSAKREVNRRWFEGNETWALRKRLIWTDQAENVITWRPYFRAQEHSAQIHRGDLHTYEEAFDKGQINILDCSTTMEMGVDIADVHLVGNTNVPPSISNYRQRVGRAGRRGEPWAFGMTWCREQPLDENTFRNPGAFLQRAIKAPTVYLESEPIVQRHINALLFGMFVRTSGIPLTTSTDEFFGAPKTRGDVNASTFRNDLDKWTDPSDTLAGRFSEWLSNAADIPAVNEAVVTLVHGTSLVAKTVTHLVDKVEKELDDLRRKWREDYQVVIDRLKKSIDQKDNSSVISLFQSRAQNMAGKFILSELGSRNFLPPHGFPIDVVQLEYETHTTNLNRRRSQLRSTEVSQEDVRPLRRTVGESSRPLSIALREFSPGADVVIDGLVYRSGGVKPAWARLHGEGGTEHLERLWTCPKCEQTGIVRIFEVGQLCTNQDCKHRLRIEDTAEVLKPAGFIADRGTHAGYDVIAQAPFDPAVITLNKNDWTHLIQPKWGRFRCDSAGQIIVTAKGRDQNGFALCLTCGRMKEQLTETDEEGEKSVRNAVSLLKDHKPLEPSVVPTEAGRCPGNDQNGAIRSRVQLFSQNLTNVFELCLPEFDLWPDEVLKHMREHEQKGDYRAGVGLAVGAALREALCAALNVESQEVHVYGKRGKSHSHDSIFLYDAAEGGAGLSSQLDNFDFLVNCLQDAEKQLECQNSADGGDGCENGCPECIMRPDVAFSRILPQRKAALALLKWLLPYLSLSQDLQLFGPETHYAGQDAERWLQNALDQHVFSTLTLCMPGEPDEWDVNEWLSKRTRYMLEQSGISINLLLPRVALEPSRLSTARIADLMALQIATNADCRVVDTLPKIKDKAILLFGTARRKGSDFTTPLALATVDEYGPIVSSDWGKCNTLDLAHSCNIAGPYDDVPMVGKPLELSALLTMPENIKGTNAYFAPVTHELDGSINRQQDSFGMRFWHYWENKAGAGVEIDALRKIGVKAVYYTDRFVRSPLVVALLYSVVSTIPGADAHLEVIIKTVPLDPDEVHTSRYHRSYASKDWPKTNERDGVLKSVFPKVDIRIYENRHDMQHDRELTLIRHDGRRLTIGLGQGFGAWGAIYKPKFDFGALVDEQARQIKQANWLINYAGKGRTTLVMALE
ncbi:DEAD/DEAH box helicase [Acetobacter cerevisiae]|uniref:DEAD/DEAH box helicase n=1 Tax=Acetobacter cerevisiae TaxID=178900 RepID=A0ABT1ETI8_9PROT|nr:DEAD/DEAH box helicase [Acetobacter cerevisiae]MCP1246711.1 DEAD/DEAH box helicase [Acetobacter cerevisiae]MCP1256250.1 DEAD/DEAH box helicase [Acetobacter cerevisiae]